MTKFANGIERMDALQAFVDKYKIMGRAVPLGGDKWQITLFVGSRQMGIVPGMIKTYSEAPTVAHTLATLVREGRTFCAQRTDTLRERDGLSTDDAKAAAFAALKETSRLARFLGESAYDELYAMEGG